MTITAQSRYALGTLTRVPTAASSAYQQAVFRTVPVQTANYRLHIWTSTDRPDSVASQFLGDPRLWWQIFDYNPELIYPLNIPVGTVVRIPTLTLSGQTTAFQ